METSNTISIPALVAGLVCLSGYLFTALYILRAIQKAEDGTARKYWVWAFLSSGIPFIFFVIAYLFYEKPIVEKINTISSVLICVSPVLLITGLIYFTRRASWFWKNRTIFPNDIINKGLIRRKKADK